MKPGWRWWLVFRFTLFVLVAMFAVPVTIWRLYGLNLHTVEMIGFIESYGPWLLAALTAILVYESFRVGRRMAFTVCAFVVGFLLFFALEREANIETCDAIHGYSEGSFGDTFGFMIQQMIPPTMLQSRIAARCEIVL